jgi:hypothetical protein
MLMWGLHHLLAEYPCAGWATMSLRPTVGWLVNLGRAALGRERLGGEIGFEHSVDVLHCGGAFADRCCNPLD